MPYCGDGSMPDNHALDEMLNYVKEGMANLGKDTTAIMTVDDELRAAGFSNITRRVFQLLVGPWAKGKSQRILGIFWRTVIMDGIQGITMGTLGRGLNWSPEEIELYLVGVRKSITDPAVHSYWPYHIIIAQKPAT